MKPINWQRICDDNRIPYIDRGANVKRGEISVHCPMCGSADPSYHMGLNLENGYWACWRNQNHRGRSPVRLLIALLGISYRKALEIAGLDASYVDPEGFDAVAARLMKQHGFTKIEEINHKREFLQFPREFVPITGKGRTRRCWEYLAFDRTFGAIDTIKLCAQYDIHTATDGPFRDRVVLPYYLNEELVSWTGRAIADATIRYRDLDVESSLVPPKETLFNHDCGHVGGHVLVVVEGPIDALKLDYFGRDWGLRAVSLSTNSITDQQVFLLEDLSARFQRCMIMMDNKSQLGIIDSMRMKSRLAQIKNLEFVRVPGNYGDAGALPPTSVVQFCRSVTS